MAEPRSSQRIARRGEATGRFTGALAARSAACCNAECSFAVRHVLSFQAVARALPPLPSRRSRWTANRVSPSAFCHEPTGTMCAPLTVVITASLTTPQTLTGPPWPRSSAVARASSWRRSRGPAPATSRNGAAPKRQRGRPCQNRRSHKEIEDAIPRSKRSSIASARDLYRGSVRHPHRCPQVRCCRCVRKGHGGKDAFARD